MTRSDKVHFKFIWLEFHWKPCFGLVIKAKIIPILEIKMQVGDKCKQQSQLGLIQYHHFMIRQGYFCYYQWQSFINKKCHNVYSSNTWKSKIAKLEALTGNAGIRRSHEAKIIIFYKKILICQQKETVYNNLIVIFDWLVPWCTNSFFV